MKYEVGRGLRTKTKRLMKQVRNDEDLNMATRVGRKDK